jgi:hypothetical protein
MFSLIQAVIDIALWRSGPQRLPASRFLLLCLTAFYAVVSSFQVMLFGRHFPDILLLIAIDVGVMSVWTWSLLRFFNKQQRFVQTLAAIFAVQSLLALVDTAARLLMLLGAGTPRLPAVGELLSLLAFLVLVGRILALAIDRSVVIGVPLMIAIAYSTLALAQYVAPDAAG